MECNGRAVKPPKLHTALQIWVKEQEFLFQGAEAVRSVLNQVFTECKSVWYPVCFLQAGK